MDKEIQIKQLKQKEIIMGATMFDKETKRPKQELINAALGKLAFNVRRSRWIEEGIMVELDDIGAKKLMDCYTLEDGIAYNFSGERCKLEDFRTMYFSAKAWKGSAYRDYRFVYHDPHPLMEYSGEWTKNLKW